MDTSLKKKLLQNLCGFLTESFRLKILLFFDIRMLTFLIVLADEMETQMTQNTGNSFVALKSQTSVSCAGTGNENLSF